MIVCRDMVLERRPSARPGSDQDPAAGKRPRRACRDRGEKPPGRLCSGRLMALATKALSHPLATPERAQNIRVF